MVCVGEYQMIEKNKTIQKELLSLSLLNGLYFPIMVMPDVTSDTFFWGIAVLRHNQGVLPFTVTVTVSFLSSCTVFGVSNERRPYSRRGNYFLRRSSRNFLLEADGLESSATIIPDAPPSLHPNVCLIAGVALYYTDMAMEVAKALLWVFSTGTASFSRCVSIKVPRAYANLVFLGSVLSVLTLHRGTVVMAQGFTLDWFSNTNTLTYMCGNMVW